MATKNKSINFKKLDCSAVSPTRNNTTDAGLDLYAIEDIIVPSLFRGLWSHIIMTVKSSWLGIIPNIELMDVSAIKVKTGIALDIPIGTYGLILDRSSMGSKLIKTLGGVIDSGYRGDITVCLANLAFHDYKILKGDKIAQIVFHKYETLQPIEVDKLNDDERGDSSFGSSGR